MQSIDRSVVIIRPKKTFVLWANSCGQEDLKFTDEYFESFHSMAILIPEYDSITTTASRKYVRSQWKDIFSLALGRWNDNKAQWPKGLSPGMLSKWFKLEFVRKVIDSLQ